MSDLTWDELDELVDTDTIALRDRAWAEIERLRALVGGDALATLEKVKRERDSLARRCAVRFEEAQKLRTELDRLRMQRQHLCKWHGTDVAEIERMTDEGELA